MQVSTQYCGLNKQFVALCVLLLVICWLFADHLNIAIGFDYMFY